ncbi:hypothetical protein BRPE64_BCDS06670 [Caballeronia insecticola]|uniref:Uncharacterized protein n=1 Tax=Caballeronia insecticola TaxID=758793 RepID=R4WL95_9BURK|nr:hypothetical protein BRPE64_BCDS06670 [Caballeronia insecticola]
MPRFVCCVVVRRLRGACMRLLFFRAPRRLASLLASGR